MKQAVNEQHGLMSPQQAAGLNGDIGLASTAEKIVATAVNVRLARRPGEQRPARGHQQQSG